MSWFQAHLSRKFFLGFLLSAALPMLLLGYLSIKYVTEQLTLQSEDNLQSSAKEMGMQIINKLILARQQLQLIASHPRDRSAVQNQTHPFTDIILHTDRQPAEVLQGYNALEAAEIRQISRTLNRHAATLFTTASSLYLAVPIRSIHSADAMLIGRLNVKDVLPGSEYLSADTVMCVHDAHQLLACLSNEGVSRTQPDSGHDGLSKTWSIFLQGEFSTQFNSTDWTVEVTQSKRQMARLVKRYYEVIPPIVLLVIALVSFIATRFIRALLKPLRAYAETAEAISIANLSTHVDIAGSDEVARAGQAFNRMIDRIRDEKTAFESRLEKKANFDELTELPNRNLLHACLGQAMTNASVDDTRVAVLFLDLNDFKSINDSMGHRVGDLLLKEVAARLSSSCRAGDSIFRFGGDEFIIILTDIEVDTRHELASLVSGIVSTIRQPVTLQGYEFKTSASVGIALYPTDAMTAEALIQHADTAMYKAKNAESDSVVFFKQAFHDQLVTRIHLEKKIRRALNHDEFELYYQPQIDSVSGEIVGAEALIRWNDPDKGLISPDDFLPVAEQSGLILPIGEWVINTACQQARRWQHAYPQPLRLAINVSARQFSDDHLLSHVSYALQRHHLDPALLELEITEQVAIKDINQTIRILEALQALGVHTAVDDFGTGYSSLAYLSQFPLRTLKVDQSFTQSMTPTKDGLAIVTAIIAMAHALSLEVVAEGVETPEQQTLLQRLKCDYLQGYLFSRPLPANQFMALLDQQQKPLRTPATATSSG
jgi:diguanylate cyclase (GGDEF)-like protein